MKNPPANAENTGSAPELGRSPGGGNGNLLQYFCLENHHGQRSLVGYNPWGRKELDTTERLSTHADHAKPWVYLIIVLLMCRHLQGTWHLLGPSSLLHAPRNLQSRTVFAACGLALRNRASAGL